MTLLHTAPVHGDARPRIGSLRRTSLAAGILYLITIVASIPAQFVLYDPVLNDAGFVLGSGSEIGVLWGGLLEVVTALTCIGTAVVLFPVVKRQNETLALGFVTARVLEAALIIVGVVSLLAVVSLRQAGTDGTAAESLVTAGRALVAVRDQTFLLGPGLLPGVNALLLGYLMYKSRLVPRLIPLIGLLGAPLFLVSAATSIVGVNDQVSVLSGVAVIPIGLWELTLGVWLVLKGFTPAAITAGMEAASAPPANRVVS